MKAIYRTLFTILAFASPASAAPAQSVTFHSEILPALTRLGCNSARCHGAAAGSGGFRLTLFASDPDVDYLSVVRDLEGRRIDLADPSRSLILRKPAGLLPHGGGRLLPPGSAVYKSILEWIRQGAAQGRPPSKEAVLDPSPAQLYLQVGASARMKVRLLEPGIPARSVDSLTLWTAGNEEVASIDSSGRVLAKGAGITSITARTGSLTASIRLAVAAKSGSPDPDHSSAVPGDLDGWVAKEHRRLNESPSPRCDDLTFLRRVYIDLTGSLPPVEEAAPLLPPAQQLLHREKLVDRLLSSDQFTAHWTQRLSDILITDSRRLGREPYRLLYSWLRSQIDKPGRLDQIFRTLLTATGDGSNFGPANFYRRTTDPRDTAEFVARRVMGVRLECARCHNHPADRWTQTDYYRFAGIFAPLRVSGSQVLPAGAAGLPLPGSNEPLPPGLPGGPDLSGSASAAALLEDLASGLLEGIDPPAARLLVNRVWEALFGAGLISPVDDLSPSHPEAIPGLTSFLARELTASGWDLRGLLRRILLSRTYQSSVQRDASPLRLAIFAGRAARPLTALTLHRAIQAVTGQRHPDAPEAEIELADPASAPRTLQILGLCRRTEPCEQETGAGELAKTLHLFNDPGIESQIRRAAGELLSNLPDSAGRLRRLYRRAFSRDPSPAEFRRLLPDPAGELSRERLEDLIWAILQSTEFSHSF